MKVKVNVPQEIALKRGVARWGDQPVDLQEVLDQLTEQERTQLKVESEILKVLRYDSNYHGFRPTYWQLTVNEPTTDDTVRAIRAALAENEVKRLADLADWRVVLETPDNGLYLDGRRRCGYSVSDVEKQCVRLGLDPAEYQNALDIASERLAGAHLLAWRRYFNEWTPDVSHKQDLPYHRHYSGNPSGLLPMDIARRIATEFSFGDILERIQVYEDAQQAQAAQERAKVEASRRAWIEWAHHHGSKELSAAIEFDYPLGNEVEREVEAAVFPRAESNGVTTYDDVCSYEERRVPRQAAWSLHSYLTDCAADLAEKLPEGAEMVVGRISSVEIWIECDCDEEYPCGNCDRDHEVKVKRTAVPVILKALHHEATRWYVLDE